MSGDAQRSDPRRSDRAWPIAFVVVVLAMLGAGLYIFEAVRRIPGDAVEGGRAVLGELRSLAASFRQGDVETEFISYAARTTGTSYLQFATLERVETFRRRDTSSLLWGQLDLPAVVVEATAPVTYTYYVDLSADWRFVVADGAVRVIAPEVRFNKPAIDTDRIHLEPRTTSMLRDEDAALESLRQGLGELVDARARSHVSQIRETGRRQIAEFVSVWLVGAFDDGADYEVEVMFADESPSLRVPGDPEASKG